MSNFKKLCGIFFSILFLWLALRKIDFQAIPSVLSTINTTFWGLMILSYTIEMLTRAHRWLIIQPNGKITFKHSINGLILTYLFNNILPARAGELFRPYYFSQKDLATSGETLGAVVLERFFDGVMVLGLILISFQQFSNNEMLQKASIITAVFYGIVFIGILLAIFKKEMFEKTIKWCLSFLPQKANDFLYNIAMKFIEGLSTIKDLKRLIKILLSSVVCWASSVLTTWLCFKAFGFEESFITASFVLTVLSISSMIPASPGTLGVYEYFCIFLISNILGHTPEEGAAFSIILHGLQYFYTLIVGLIIALIEGVKFTPHINS